LLLILQCLLLLCILLSFFLRIPRPLRFILFPYTTLFRSIVNQSNELEGLVSRQDVLKALNEMQRQPQVGETIHDIISRTLDESVKDPDVYETVVTPQMTNQLGTLSNGVLTTLISEASARHLRQLKKGNMAVESLNIYFIEPVQIDSHLTIKPELLDAGRLYAKVNIEIFNGK